jgi:predicted ATPase
MTADVAPTSLVGEVRVPFVGRVQELEALRRALGRALRGHGGLVMLTGEPGIGKTRTAEQLATHARNGGAEVLWGASYEERGAPPYWPWLQIARGWGDANDFGDVRERLGANAAELARLIPELITEHAYPAPAVVSEPQSAQFRLFEAYVAFVRAIAQGSPVVVLLEDLHWADRPTLALLEHLARETAPLFARSSSAPSAKPKWKAPIPSTPRSPRSAATRGSRPFICLALAWTR